MAMPTTKAREAPSLFILPPEIRLKIYRYALCPWFNQLDLHPAARHSLDHPLLHISRFIRSECLSTYFCALLLLIRRAHARYRDICVRVDEQARQTRLFPQRMAAQMAAAGNWNSNSARLGSLELNQMIFRLGLLAYKEEVMRNMVETEEQRIRVQFRKWQAWSAAMVER